MKRLLAFAVLAACSSSPSNVAGNYTVAVTNRDNGCAFQNWTIGAQSTGIQVQITQQSENATALVMGGAGFVLGAVLGGNDFSGKIDGDSFDLTHTGTKTLSMNNCNYTVNGEITGTISGDNLTGRINYAAADDGSVACSSIHGCVSFQDYNGTRPPQ